MIKPIKSKKPKTNSSICIPLKYISWLDVQDFLFFGFSQCFDLAFLPGYQLIGLFFEALQFVLADSFSLLGLFDFMKSLMAGLADCHKAIFNFLMQHFNHSLAVFSCHGWQVNTYYPAIIGWC